MTKRWLHIRDGVIENISIGADEQPSDRDGLTFQEDPGGVGPGHRLVNGEWMPPPPVVPGEVTLSDWRVALIKMGRYNDIKAAVEAARDSGTVEGLIAYERFEHANHVYRDELLQMAPAFGFTEEEVDGSLLVASGVDPGTFSPSGNTPAASKRKKAKR
jgi:hypothetical protein